MSGVLPMELERTTERIKSAIEAGIELQDFHPGKVSLWLKYVRPRPQDGITIEETVGPVHKQVFFAPSEDELVRGVAENLLLFVFGAEAPVVKELPNLIVKLFDQKARVAVEGAPPLEQQGQIFLKVTVYPYHPSLWEQLFPKPEET